MRPKPKQEPIGRLARKRDKRKFDLKFKIKACQRLLAGVRIRELSHELGISRSVLHRWLTAYRQRGEAGIEHAPGRPPQKSPELRQLELEANKDRKIAELQRTVGQMQMENRFLRSASKRLKESRQPSAGTGETASTGPSGK